MQHFLRYSLLLCLSVALPACGFSLRSADQSPLPITALELRTTQQSSAFIQQLRDSLTAANVATNPSGGQSSHVLSIGEEQTSTRTASVNSRARAAQYDLQLAVDVQLESNGAVIFGPETLAVQRSYYEDIANIAGSNEEMELLRTEMRQELVDQLLRRLRAAANDPNAQ